MLTGPNTQQEMSSTVCDLRVNRYALLIAGREWSSLVMRCATPPNVASVVYEVTLIIDPTCIAFFETQCKYAQPLVRFVSS